MKKIILITSLCLMLTVVSCSKLKLINSTEIYEDPNVIVITIKKK